MKFNPDITLLIINHKNARMLLADMFDWEKFMSMTFQLQSDVVFVALLYKYGGAAIDIDMIYTKKFDLFTNADSDTLYMLGRPNESAHLAFFLTHNPKNILLWHILQMQKCKVSLIKTDHEASLPWDYVGNSIINPLVREIGQSPMASKLSVIPNDSMFLETMFGLARKYDMATYGIDIYRKFYFSTDINFPIKFCTAAAHYGLVYLHNSWTPNEYKTMTASEFISQDIMLAKLLRHLLGVENITKLSLDLQ